MELFKYPFQLLWLAIAFAALVFFYLKARASAAAAAAALISPRLLSRLAGEKTLARRRAREWLYLAALAFLIAAAGGPQWGLEMSPVMEMNGSLVLAVDTSASMGARDIKPSRIESAKLLLSALADRFQDYRTGIIAFSGEAFVQCPLTTDSEAVKYFLSYLAPGILPVPGTDLAAAMGAAEAMLSRYSGQKVLVLITDGEDLEGRVDAALDSAAAANLRIFTVGMGRTEGELIPVQDPAGGMTEYKKDRSGKTVVTRLNEAALLKIAQKTGAAYLRYGGEPEAAADEIRDTVARIETARAKGLGRAGYKNRYRVPLLLAFLLLLVEFMFMEKGLVLPAFLAAALKRLRKKPAAAALLLSLAAALSGTAGAASPESMARSGNRAYEKEDFQKAREYYSGGLEKAPKNRKILFNRGAAYYRMEDYSKAAEDFGEAAADPKFKSAAAYNEGNAHFRLSDFPKAVEKYREALIADPGADDARYNLQKALEAKKKNQNQCKNPDQKKQEERKKQEQQRKQESKSGGGDDKDKKDDEKKREEREKQQAARRQADKLLELMKEKEKSSANRDLMNSRFSNKPHADEKPSGKDW